MVAEIIEQKKDEIAALCRKHSVQGLDALDSLSADGLAFLIDLGDPNDRLFDRYIDFVLELENLLAREVFLVSAGYSVTIPHRAEWIEESRVTIHES